MNATNGEARFIAEWLQKLAAAGSLWVDAMHVEPVGQQPRFDMVSDGARYRVTVEPVKS